MRTGLIDAGLLNHEMVLEVPVETPDGAGGFTTVWTGVATIWARLEPLDPARESWAGRDAAEQTHRITIRFRDDVKQGMRLRRLTRLFPVLSVQDPDETGRFLVCRTREESE
jgi:SPP1 family predicted phage head-tail adaptor